MERKLTAILCADVHGYSRLMGLDDEATLQTLTSHRRLIDSSIERHHGRFVNSAGDSVLAEFASVIDAVNCAVDVQTSLKAENAKLSDERRMQFRIGVNLGEVMVQGEQIYGDGVNVAARLENLAEPGGICISGKVRAEITSKLALNYTDLGEQRVKNIVEPVRVLRVLLDGTRPQRAGWRKTRQYWRPGALSLTGVAIIVGTFILVPHLSLKPPHTSASIPPPEKSPLPLPSIPSIAVLPFTNLSSDPQQEYFSDGIANQLIEDLSRLPGLFVIARNSSFAYKGKAIDEHQIGRALGVKYLLEGNVMKTANKVRIGVELVDASAGTEMWTQRFDRPLKDIFVVQDEIVEKVVTTLGLLLKLNQMRLPQAAIVQPTDNLEAFDDYLRAAEYTGLSTKNGNTQARAWLDKAMELDPHFADAISAEAWTYLLDGWNQWGADPQADFAHARQLGQRALMLDDTNANALAMLTELDWQQGRYDQAVADGKRAVAINPNYAMGNLALADAFDVDGKPGEALRAAEAAARLDPAARDFYAYQVGMSYVDLGRYAEALSVLKRHLAVYPNSLVGHLAIITAYTELGREQEAREEAAEVIRISPHFALASLRGNKQPDVGNREEKALREAGLK